MAFALKKKRKCYSTKNCHISSCGRGHIRNTATTLEVRKVPFTIEQNACVYNACINAFINVHDLRSPCLFQGFFHVDSNPVQR